MRHFIPLLLLSLLFGSSIKAQSSYTYIFSEAGVANSDDLGSQTINEYLSFTTAKNSSSTNPKYYNTGSAGRFYYNSSGDGGSLTLHTSNGAIITGLEIVAYGSYTPTVKYSVDNQAQATASLNDVTYTINGIAAETSLLIQNANTSSNTQLRVVSLVITYSTGEEEEEPLNCSPITEDFSAAFSAAPNFLPNWTVEETGNSNKYVRNTSDVNSAGGALEITPTSGYHFYGTWNADVSNCEDLILSFYLASLQNSSARPALLDITFYEGNTLVHTSETFSVPNANTPYELKAVSLPAEIGNTDDLNIVFHVTRGDGSGSTAKLLLDDIKLETKSESDLAIVLEAYKIDNKTIEFSTTKSITEASASNLANYTGLSNITSVTAKNPTDTVFQIHFSQNIPFGAQSLTINGLQTIGMENVLPFTWNFTNINDAMPALLITEIMYNPIESGSDVYEYIEVYNNDDEAVDLVNFYLEGVTYTFPSISLEPGETFLLAGNATECQALFGADFTEWESGALTNGGETISIFNEAGEVVVSVTYSSNSPWPTKANGNGPSIELPLENFLLNSNEGNSWQASYLESGNNANGTYFGSPGFITRKEPGVLDVTVILPDTILVQLERPYATAEIASVNIGGELGKNGVLSVGENDSAIVIKLPFHLVPGLFDIQLTNLLEEDLTNYPDIKFTANVPNYTNPKLWLTEIMYNPPESGTDKNEFLELFNAGEEVAYLHDLSFSNGVVYTFQDMTLEPGETVLIGVNKESFEQTFNMPCLEWFSGSLSNSGERITLVNSAEEIIFDITYDDSGDWNKLADGSGSSLALDTSKADKANAGSSWFGPNKRAGWVDTDAVYATPGSVTFTKTPYVFVLKDTILVPEGVTNFPIVISSKYTSDMPAEFSLKLENETASDEDYEMEKNGHFVALPGDTTYVYISTFNDSDDESDEFVKVTLVPESNCAVLQDHEFWIRINNKNLGESSPATGLLDICCHQPDKPLFYPNPAIRNLFFSEPTSGDIVNLYGLVVIHFEGKKQISIRDLLPGTYIVKTEGGRQSILIKI